MESRLTPLAIDTKLNATGYLVIASSVVGVMLKWNDFRDFFLPDNSTFNWPLFILLTTIFVSMVGFVFNTFWKREYDLHEVTKKDRDNLIQQLKISENERLTDVITGIPNTRSLEKDIEHFFTERSRKSMQFILIDLKDFRAINKRFGYTKTNDLLRLIAQTIYRSMRRNEDMYKYFDGENKKPNSSDWFYRIYPGGDEFAFVIEGDQAEALGFSNRLTTHFANLSELASSKFGEQIKLSFHCAIVEMDARDTYRDILKKAEDCYQIAKEGTSAFNICWHPIDRETTLSRDTFKSSMYKKTRELFEVLTLNDPE